MPPSSSNHPLPFSTSSLFPMPYPLDTSAPGVYSHALKRVVWPEDQCTIYTMSQLCHAMKADCSLRSLHLSVDVPPFPDEERQPKYKRVQVTVTLDVEVGEEWLSNTLYHRAEGGELTRPKKPAVFVDLEQFGTKENCWSGWPATIELGVPGPNEDEDDFRVLILQICKMKSTPSTLKRIVEDTRALKIFHGFRKDIELLRMLGFEPKHCVEINSLVHILLRLEKREHQHIPCPQIDFLVERYLGIELDEATLPPTKWNDTYIHPWKLRYGALDVWVLWGLYRVIMRHLLGLPKQEEVQKFLKEEVAKRLLEFNVGGVDAVYIGE
ncbi:hypothetical protein HDV00_009228 [Rhizophlyctis rosea]|nr:hypothetical protein HDV00_009228 [Rhizophlyctis rosea]